MEKICKYCNQLLEDSANEGLTCKLCNQNVHLTCLKSGTVPGGIHGDVFHIFTCQECTDTGSEIFEREKLSWMKILYLVLYHLQVRSRGLAKKGFFHWRNHIAAYIDKDWDIIFPRNFKKKKRWIGTVAGTLSHFSCFFFTSGISVFNEPAWWSLKYPKLSPYMISNIYQQFTLEKQNAKSQKYDINDQELFQQILNKYVKNKDLLAGINVEFTDETSNDFETNSSSNNISLLPFMNKRKNILPTFESTSKKLKLRKSTNVLLQSNLNDDLIFNNITNNKNDMINEIISKPCEKKNEKQKLLDPMCHYNTSLNNMSFIKGNSMKIRIMGGMRNELILSPYSGIYLKPYIRRDTETFPPWLRLMNEIILKVNRKYDKKFILPSRAPLDFTYVQPEHIPAINSLCNHFFWPGIDLTDCLQYPDFSCVVLYKKLIVAFAFVIPNVSYTENYISFIFTRPGWRNVGIAKFMIYHLIQTSLGKDLTIHVSINNPALFLYQKFGFKVESVELLFYDKYIRSDTKESKHAFFCRLER